MVYPGRPSRYHLYHRHLLEYQRGGCRQLPPRPCRTETIEGLQEVDEEGLKQAAADWKVKAEERKAELTQSKADAKKEMDDFRFDNALAKSLVSDYNVKEKYVSDVTNRLKHEEITLTDKGFAGLKEQVEPMKEGFSDLFTPDKDLPTFVKGSKNSSVLGDKMTDSIMEGAGLSTDKG